MARSELIFGVHAVRHALVAAPERALELWLLEGATGTRLREIEALAVRAGVSAQRVPRSTLDRLTGGAVHQGVILRRRPMAAAAEATLEQVLDGVAEPLVLVLDGIQDPHNLGACLRAADAAGANAVLAPRHRAAALTPAARKAASGAAEHTPFVQVGNLARALAALKERDVRVVGAVADAPCSLFDADFTGPLALVLGAEDRGLRRLTREACDALVHLPMHGAVESLNVSVTAGVLLYEALRQRRRP